MKYVLVTGGVVSGLGKGVTASSIGVLLKACGHRVTSIKIGTCPVEPRTDNAPLTGFPADATFFVLNCSAVQLMGSQWPTIQLCSTA